MKKQKLLISIAISTIALILLTGSTKAVYQTVAGSTTRDQNQWLRETRRMEEEGQIFGLKETIDEDTLVADKSNNIDVHMVKNTEWGAMLILTSSTVYGKQPQSTDTSYLQTSRYMIFYDVNNSNVADRRYRSSTGNNTGVFVDYYNDWKLTAAVFTSGIQDSGYYNTIDSRYINKYPVRGTNSSQYVANGFAKDQKAGDAMWDTYNWHIRDIGNDDFKTNEGSKIVRSYFYDGRKSEFAFSGDGNNPVYRSYSCIVNGEGI